MVMAESEKQETASNGVQENAEDKYMEGVAMLDFDMLCAAVALQTGGFSRDSWANLEVMDEDGGNTGGVQRMWEGGVLDCFEDRRIALETTCCPCYRFGKNMRRAGFGSCFIQGTVYFILAVTALLNFIAFAVAKQYCFLYLAVAFTMSAGSYLGFFRTQIRSQFNIMGGDSCLDDCASHLICPYCTLCQESRTLEINNVRDGIWLGRGDTVCIGSYSEGSKALFELCQSPPDPTKSPDLSSMERAKDTSDHSWSIDMNHSQPLVLPSE